MALVLADRVQETTDTTGTGTVTLAGAVSGYQSFAAIGNANTTYYTITSGTAWEVGLGTYTSAGTTLARTTILASSAAGAAITLAGTSNVFATYPAEKSVNQDASGNVNIGQSASALQSGGTGITLYGTSYAEIKFINSGTGTSITDGTALVASGLDFGTNNREAGSVTWGTSNTERMRINSAGNVGIGVTAMSFALQVAGTIVGVSATTTTNTTITPTAGTTNQYTVTALASGATITTPSGSTIDGQRLVIRIKDNGTARALAWTTTSGAYRAVGVTLPTTTVVSKTLYVGCIYNSLDTFWDVIAIAQEA